jgi:putative intracellular protease/amidase
MKHVIVVLIAMIACATAALADEAVQLSGGYGLLNAPRAPRAAIVLIPGGNGHLGIRGDGSFSALRGNQLVRTRAAYASAGVASLVVDGGVSVASAVAYLRQRFNRPVTVAATSRGSLRIAEALNARPNGIAITAGFLDQVRGQIGSPGALPATLVVHHRRDGCQVTPPSGVEPFKAWGGARVRVVWIDGGANAGDPCQAGGYHGFAGNDGRVVGAVAGFAKGLR